MSKTKRLLDVVDGLRSLADSLEQVAGCIAGNTAAAQSGSEKRGEPMAATQPASPAPPTIDQVRALLAEKSGAGKTKEVKALLMKYDAGKLSGVKPEDYPALMEEAGKL